MGLAKMFLQNSNIVKALAKSVCKKVGIMTPRVCEGTLDSMADPVIYILQHTKYTAPEFCAALLHPDCLTHLNVPMGKNVVYLESIELII